MTSFKLRNLGFFILGLGLGISLSLGIKAIAQNGNNLPTEEIRQLSNVFATVKNNYVDTIDDKTLIHSAITGMVSSLDPHSAYLDINAFREIQSVTQGEFNGLGMEISAEGGFIKVISPVEESPASRAGVISGDLIIKIDETPTKGISLSDAVRLMRGPLKSPVMLTILRGDGTRPLLIKVTRDIIHVHSVKSKMLDENIAYLRITQFQEKTGYDFVQELRAFGEESPPSSLILDLRNNPGGVLTSTIGVAGAFLPPESLVVSTEGRAPYSCHRYLSTPDAYAQNGNEYLKKVPGWVKNVPMVVLVNTGSASASEIVAGALQDYGRAKVLGNRTFGKGSVQVILPLTDIAALKLTTSRYSTPNGRAIQLTGIEPDYVVADTALGNSFNSLREVNLKHHLSSEQKDYHSLEYESESKTERITKGTLKFGSHDDFQLQKAINLLQDNPT